MGSVLTKKGVRMGVSPYHTHLQNIQIFVNLKIFSENEQTQFWEGIQIISDQGIQSCIQHNRINT